MPDFTITITAVEAGVLASYYPTTEDGVEAAVRRVVRVQAMKLIFDSNSAKDPRKMDDQELRDELLVIAAQVPTFCERPENFDHPDCLAESSSSGA